MAENSTAYTDDVYVQIPAYRDRELGPTLHSLYAHACHPERLRVRVLWQRGPGEALPKTVEHLPGLEIDEVPASQSQGCNWARRRLQDSWNNERYTILLDSHHRFVDGWDDESIAMLEHLRETAHPSPVLTGYLPAYLPESGWLSSHGPQFIYPYERDNGVLTRLRSLPIQDADLIAAPIPADFASLHFLVADGRFNGDLPFLPDVYFFGDEVLTSVRAFCAGYRLFHPHRLIGWHAYDRSARVTHWNDHPGYEARHQTSLDTLRRWFTGAGGLSAAQVAEFEDHINFSLVTR